MILVPYFCNIVKNNSMAATYNFPSLKKGDTFLGVMMTVNINDLTIDTSLYTVRMQLRRAPSKASPVAFEFSSATGKDGTIALGAGGVITFQPVIIDIPAGLYYIDIEFTNTSTGVVRTWVEGTWTIETEVTQD